MDTNRFLPYFNCYYYFYLVGGLAFQSILFYLIIKKSPPILDNMKLCLYNTWINQCCLISMGFFTQNRMLPNKTSLAILPNGPCKYFGRYTCFVGYHIFIAFSSSVALSISNTIAFRFLVLRLNNFDKKNIRYMIGASCILVIIVAAIPFTDEWNFERVQNMTRNEHPSYDLSIYHPFPGFYNISSIPFLSVTILIALGVYGIPFLSAFFTRYILVMINTNSNMSNRTKNSAKMLVRGLACQTMLPLMSYVPIVSLYLYSQTTGQEILLVEHLLMACSGFPAFVDPFITIYFIIPYRQAILRIITPKRVNNQESAMFSTAFMPTASMQIPH